MITLIYYIYKERYNYSLNINTILTVLGTIFGAYFGAKVAGKYAVDSVEKQIHFQQLSEEKRENRMLYRNLTLYKLRLEKIEGLLSEALPNLKQVVKRGMKTEDIEIFSMVKSEIMRDYSSLEKIDSSEVYSEDIFIILIALENISNIVDSFEKVILAISEKSSSDFEYHFNHLTEGRKSIVEDLKYIDISLQKNHN